MWPGAGTAPLGRLVQSHALIRNHTAHMLAKGSLNQQLSKAGIVFD